MNALIFISLWGPVFLWAALIFWLSSIPHLTTGWGIWDFILRKGAHMTEYAVLTFLLWRALRQTCRRWTENTTLWMSAIIAVLYAFSDEFHQSFVPGRTPAVKDVLIDTMGVIIFMGFYRYLHLKQKGSLV